MKSIGYLFKFFLFSFTAGAQGGQECSLSITISSKIPDQLKIFYDDGEGRDSELRVSLIPDSALVTHEWKLPKVPRNLRLLWHHKNTIRFKELRLAVDSNILSFGPAEILSDFEINHFIPGRDLTTDDLSLSSLEGKNQEFPFMRMNLSGENKIDFHLFDDLKYSGELMITCKTDGTYIARVYSRPDYSATMSSFPFVGAHAIPASSEFRESRIKLFSDRPINQFYLLLSSEDTSSLSIRGLRLNGTDYSRSWRGLDLLDYFDVAGPRDRVYEADAIRLNSKGPIYVYPAAQLLSREAESWNSILFLILVIATAIVLVFTNRLVLVYFRRHILE